MKCFVVIELKIDDFKPEYPGKLNFYLSVVDDLLKQPDDAPSIGLLLCPRKNDVVVEYALRDVNKPMGIATYQLTKKIPATLQANLPTEDELKMILKDIQDLSNIKNSITNNLLFKHKNRPTRLLFAGLRRAVFYFSTNPI